MDTREDILSFMDLLDLDEEIIDARLQSIMARDTYTNKHLKNAIQLLQYKNLINLQEGTECENEEEFTFVVKLTNQVSHENAVYVCRITNEVLSLNSSSLVNKSEHLLQQILSDICISSTQVAPEDLTLLYFKLCDSMLDAVIQIGEKLTLPFLEIPVSRILHSPDEQLRGHFLMSTVPKIFVGVQGYNILDIIWNTIKEFPNESNEISLKILSSLSEYYIPVADKQGKVSFESEVVYQVDFWKMLLCGLCYNDSTVRKISVYLGKRAIDCLTASKRDINLSLENKIFSWDHKRAGELKSEWDNFFVLIDSLEEKQSNIVLPSLHIFEKLKHIEECWLDCLFNLGLQHDNTQVRLKCIMLKLNSSLKSLNEAVVLLEALNDNNIFDEVIGYVTLKTKIVIFFSDEKTLPYILKALTFVKWAPVPLYHITDALNKLNIRKCFTVENLTASIIEILKIPCNNVLLRKAVHINLFSFIEQCYIRFHWRDLLNIYLVFQVKLPTERILTMFTNLLEHKKEKLEFLQTLLELTNNHEKLALVLMYLDKQPQDTTCVVELVNAKVKYIQNIVNRQYSNRKDCFDDVISMAIIYSMTQKKHSPCAEVLNKILSQEIKLIMQYLLAFISSDIMLNVEEMVLISEILQKLDEIPKDSILQLNKISILLFTDKTSNLDKTALGLFIIHSLMKNPFLVKHCKHEMITLKHLLEIKKFDKKQNSRLVNAFYDKLCECIFEYIEQDRNLVSTRNILDFIETVTECGGYGCLYWILKIMNIILPMIFDDKDIKFDISQFVHRMWKEIEELKSNSQYNPCMEEFISLIMQDNLLNHPMYNNVITMYSSKIIENAIVRNTPLYYMVKKLINTEVNMNRGHLIYILCEILMYAPVPRKDLRITGNLMIEILQDPKYKEFTESATTHFNFQIQYSAIAILKNIKHAEIYQLITSYITNKIDSIFKNKQRYHGNSQAHRTLLIAVQHLLYIFLLQPSLGDLGRVKDWCLQLLAKLPHQPSVKLFLEWFIALFYYMKGATVDNDFISYLDSAKVPITSQFIIIYFIMKKKIKTKYTEEEYTFVLTYFLGNTMGPMYNVRLYAQCISKQLFQLKEIPAYKYMMELVIQNCCKDKNCTKLEEDFFMSRFDIISELSPTFIYYFVPKYTEAVNEYIYTECITDELKIINKTRDNLKEYAPNRQLSDEEVFAFDYSKRKANVVENTDDTSSSIQKKYIPWRCMSDVNGYEVVKKKESQSELIVVASLIDKLPNLGGMARTSEVFGVKTYVVDSLRHLQDRQFQALSVSAERWVNIEEVRPGAPLKKYLHSKKTEGYTVVAAEQTSTSCQLNTFKFPKKTVLLLGHEKEGIPCDLLPLMDHCVEVPQQGVVRSLNVHVTAAIFVWEYSRQHIL